MTDPENDARPPIGSEGEAQKHPEGVETLGIVVLPARPARSGWSSLPVSRDLGPDAAAITTYTSWLYGQHQGGTVEVRYQSAYGPRTEQVPVADLPRMLVAVGRPTATPANPTVALALVGPSAPIVGAACRIETRRPRRNRGDLPTEPDVVRVLDALPVAPDVIVSDGLACWAVWRSEPVVLADDAKGVSELERGVRAIVKAVTARLVAGGFSPVVERADAVPVAGSLVGGQGGWRMVEVVR